MLLITDQSKISKIICLLLLFPQATNVLSGNITFIFPKVHLDIIFFTNFFLNLGNINYVIFSLFCFGFFITSIFLIHNFKACICIRDCTLKI